MKNIKLLMPLILSFFILVLVESFKPKPIDWTPTFEQTDKNPFGSFALFNRLPDIFPDIVTATQPLYNTLQDSLTSPIKNYIIVNNSFSPDRLDLVKLLEFTAQGGNVFIAAAQYSESLLDTLDISSDFSLMSDSLLVTESSVENALPYEFKKQGLFWFFDSLKTYHKILAKFSDNKVCFVSIRFGRGTVYLHSIPFVFTNFNMLKNQNADYLSRALSYLPDKPTVWDEYYKDSRRAINKTPLSFILNNDSLKWAYYMGITGVLLFIVFNGKRRQRIIPVIEPLKNETLNFADTIGRLYFQHANHRDVAYKMQTYFMEYLRYTYNIDTAQDQNKLIPLIGDKTGLAVGEIADLFERFNQIKSRSVSTAFLGDLNRRIEKFYSLQRNSHVI